MHKSCYCYESVTLISPHCFSSYALFFYPLTATTPRSHCFDYYYHHRARSVSHAKESSIGCVTTFRCA